MTASVIRVLSNASHAGNMLFTSTHRISSHMDLQRLKANLALRLFAWRYIPVIGFCAPSSKR